MEPRIISGARTECEDGGRSWTAKGIPMVLHAPGSMVVQEQARDDTAVPNAAFHHSPRSALHLRRERNLENGRERSAGAINEICSFDASQSSKL